MRVERLSLLDGQSFADADIISVGASGGVFEEYTLCFRADGREYCSHQFSVSNVHLRRQQPKVAGRAFHKLVVCGNVVLGPGVIVDAASWEAAAVPELFCRTGGAPGQLVLHVHDGLYVVNDWNVALLQLTPDASDRDALTAAAAPHRRIHNRRPVK